MSLIAIGKKGAAVSKRAFKDILAETVTWLSYPVNFPLAMAISQKIIQNCQNKDKIVLFYHKFHSAMATDF